MFSYFIDYNRNRFEEKTFLDLVEITKLIASWKTSQTQKSLTQIEKIISKNRKFQDLLGKNINVRNYNSLYFAKNFTNKNDIPEKNDLIRREENNIYSWTHSPKFAVTVSDYQNGHKKPNSAGIVAVSKNIKKEDILLDVYKLLSFIDEIFSEIDETDLKVFLKKTQGADYDKDLVGDFLYSYHKLEEYATKEQEILVIGNNKNNKCSVVAWYKHEDGIFREDGWNSLTKY
jgi:hypothetical protein